jgi:hypothetical protein
MSPEHAAERLDLIGPATDIYGLSATLDVVLTGWPPFVESDAVQVLLQVRRQFPQPPAGQPPRAASAGRRLSQGHGPRSELSVPGGNRPG